MLLELPYDVLIKILQHLKIGDIRNVILTCKTLKDIILHDNALWRTIYRNKLLIRNGARRQPSTYSLYNQFRISHNWVKGFFKSKVVIQHQINYMPWLKYHNSEALLVTVGSELRCYPNNKHGLPNCRSVLWKLDVPITKRDDIRTNDISRFVIKDKILVCGNRDGGVAVYKQDHISEKPHLLRHIPDCHNNGKVEVSAVELVNYNNQSFHIVTGSIYSSDLCFWNFEQEDNFENNNSLLTSPLPAHLTVKSLATNIGQNYLAIGPEGRDKPILYDLLMDKILPTVKLKADERQTVRDVQWHNENTIAYVTHSGTLGLLDTRTYDVVYHTEDPFLSSLYCVKTDGDRSLVVGSSVYSRCVLFDIRRPLRHVQIYFTQKKTSPVYSLDFDTTKLITAADRGVSVLNFNVKSFLLKPIDYSF